MTIENNQGLLTQNSQCIGYLFNFQGHGVYDPNGKVDSITEEQAQAHNKLLSQGEILGLENNCQIGQRGTFYFIKGAVQTWVGEIVDPRPTVNGQSITFKRAGKVFRGRLQKENDCFNFRRVK